MLTKSLVKGLLAMTLVATGCITPKQASTPASAAKPANGAAPQGAAPAAGARPQAPQQGIKPYSQVITKDAKSRKGLFTVHQIGEKYYYQIPDSLLGREMLLVSRIAQTADNVGYGGEKLNRQVVRWERKGDNILLRTVSYSNVAADSLPIYQAVKNSNLEPIIASFSIAALGKDSASTVIQIDDLFTKDVPVLGLQRNRRTQYQVRRVDDKRSYMEFVRSYPQNVEARAMITYDVGNPPSQNTTGTLSLLLHHSMILLPKEPMMPRLWDWRVGYFGLTQTDFGTEEHRAINRRYIVRWRLEPKDPAAFARGELVEPVKPIVYYIDPATPEKWRKYLKQGVEDWQPAFEAAGFKNAIIAKDAPSPEEDPEFHPEDVRYSVIRYFSSTTQNAYGPNEHDPRSGEILESDIGWYHNVMNLLRNWFFVQTAAVNPDAQKAKFDDEVMGELIRFVSAHEVGHTLGLPHNMKSSSAYPVDSLRSKTFTDKYNTAPSIMDYARFNYVAQPGDKVKLFPGVGPYDKYSIMWGYRPIPGAKTPDEEKDTLNKWILEKQNDPMYRFGDPSQTDPRAQTEDLGDNSVKASEYGIANLKRIVPNLIKWTTKPNEDYSDLQELYGQVLGQWNRYVGHVATNVGGVYEDRKYAGQAGAVYTPVEKARQKQAMDFIVKEVFNTPTWVLDQKILSLIEGDGFVERMRRSQVNALNNVMNPQKMQRMIEAELKMGANTYTITDLFTDVRRGVWSELDRNANIDTYRRNLQRGYIDRMAYLMTNEGPSLPAQFRGLANFTEVNLPQSDIRPLVRSELKTLRAQIQSTVSRTSGMTKIHLEDAIVRIDEILDPKK